MRVEHTGLQRYPTNLVSIPKSSNADRIAQNFVRSDAQDSSIRCVDS